MSRVDFVVCPRLFIDTVSFTCYFCHLAEVLFHHSLSGSCSWNLMKFGKLVDSKKSLLNFGRLMFLLFVYNLLGI